VKPARSIRGLIWQSTLLLRSASLLVPKGKRQEWYREWYAEVWHWAHFLHESGRLNSTTRLELARHCWGAFTDALWHRFNQERFMRALGEAPLSAKFCLSSVSLLFLFAILVSGFAPTVRSSFSPLPYYQPYRLVSLSFHGNFSHYHEGTLFNSVGDWSRRSHTASAIAAYSFHPAEVRQNGISFTTLTARVSPNFFELLGGGAAMGRLFRNGDELDCRDCVVITHRFWKSQLKSDRSIVGKILRVGSADERVIGVLPANFTFVLPEASIWTLPKSDPKISNSADFTGAVLRLASGASFSQARDEFRGFTEHADSSFGYAKMDMEPIQSRIHQGARLYITFTLLSLLGGLAVAGTRLAAARTRRLRLGWRGLLRWWSFLAIKTLLLLSTCFIVSLELSSRISIALTGTIDPFVAPFSTWFFLVTGLLALSWSMHDQCRRCRICLKRLGNEASVGVAGYLLLDWWGTELVCSDGHGLLHVPEMKSSWLEFEQWVHLDESWQPLFKQEEKVHAP
jgi:MacB-like periplasmic core domain